jgi:hypothetical protein
MFYVVSSWLKLVDADPTSSVVSSWVKVSCVGK